VGDAIGGNAAIGAGVGALFDGMRRVRYEEQQQQMGTTTAADVRGAAAKRHVPGTFELRACLRRVHVRARLHGPLMGSMKSSVSWLAVVLGVAVAALAPGDSAAAGI
jgi:hypothetical protein